MKLRKCERIHVITALKSETSILSSFWWLMLLLEAGELSRVNPDLPLATSVSSFCTFIRSMCGGRTDVPVTRNTLNCKSRKYSTNTSYLSCFQPQRFQLWVKTCIASAWQHLHKIFIHEDQNTISRALSLQLHVLANAHPYLKTSTHAKHNRTNGPTVLTWRGWI